MICLLQYVLDNASPGDPASVCHAMDDFSEGIMTSFGVWSRMSGLSKADVLAAAVRAAPSGGGMLEIGTYCGYSATRMAMAAPGVCLTTLEVDPTHVVIARNVLAMAGLHRAVDVWTGHSKAVLQRVAARRASGGEAPFSAVFMDRWGSQYMEDFGVLEEAGLLGPGSLVVADNVLQTGAPLYVWHVTRPGAYRTEFVEVAEVGSPLEDWMSVSVRGAPATGGALGAEASEHS